MPMPMPLRLALRATMLESIPHTTYFESVSCEEYKHTSILVQTVLGLPDTLSSLLDLMLVIAPAIQTTAIAGLSSVGVLLILASCVGVCCTAGMLHATRRPSVSPARGPTQHLSAYKYSQVKIIAGVKPEHLVSLSLGRELGREDSTGKGRA